MNIYDFVNEIVEKKNDLKSSHFSSGQNDDKILI